MALETEFCYAECRYAECLYAQCRYTECHYAQCVEAIDSDKLFSLQQCIINYGCKKFYSKGPREFTRLLTVILRSFLARKCLP